ncbi:MAG TPA: hypothetical protein DDZ51_14640 [Planctomycetaceae bacterium]|nr:hypothetical protein [Planctomycetaceae bacterium]
MDEWVANGCQGFWTVNYTSNASHKLLDGCLGQDCELKLSRIERFGGKVFECFGTIGTDNRRGRISASW